MKKIASFVVLFFCILNAKSQENWVKFDENPVLQRDTVFASLSPDFYAISDNWVLKEGTVYKMWYTCGGFNYPTDEFNLKARICYCESEDGINWEKYASNPVLDVAYGDGWDSLGVETVSVIIDPAATPDQRYKMWYAGVTGTDGTYNLGYAFSPDGLTWTKHLDPILTVGGALEWDNGFLEGPSVIKDESGYKMWYAAFDGVFEGGATDGFVNIGYATSSDGINWTKYAGNPVLSVSDSGWDSIYVQDPHVIKQGSIYHLWYGGVNQYDFFGQEIGYAVSNDGINWTKSPDNPVLKRGEMGDWDANTASFPSVIIDSDGQLKMWYTGKDIEPLPEGSTDYYWEIGFALGDTLTLKIQENVRGELTVYPNPFSNVLQLKSEFPLGLIQVLNPLGEIVFSESTPLTSYELNTSQLSPGIYFVVIHDKAQLLIRKIVKE